MQLRELIVVKKDGEKSPFDRDKLARSLNIALRKRQVEEDRIDRVVCHQVGVAHQRMLLERLGIDLAKDYSTFQTYGNTGSAALPITLSEASMNGHIQKGDTVAMLGIGSGLNCMMMAARW